MDKVGIQRFRQIKARLKEIAIIDNEEISKEEDEKLEQELKGYIEEFQNKDLSDIPFEEYEDFYDFGFDFNGTKANIDFNFIDRSYAYSVIRVKGCNIRNLDLSTLILSEEIDDDSFDKEIMEANPEYFPPKVITDPEVRERFYRKFFRIYNKFSRR